MLALAEQDHIFSKETIRICILQVCERDTNRVCAVFKIEVSVLSLCKHTQYVDSLRLANYSVNIIHFCQFAVLLSGGVHQLRLDKHVVVREDGLFNLCQA